MERIHNGIKRKKMRMKELINAFCIGVLLFAVNGCCYSDACSPCNGGEYRTMRCDAIYSSQTEEFSFSVSNKVEATAKVNIIFPVDKCLRDFAEDNIARNWKCANFGRCAPVKGYKDVLSGFLEDFKETQAENKKEFLKNGDTSLITDWELSLSSKITLNGEKCFSFQSYAYTYFGGAHPGECYWNGTYSRALDRRMVVSDLFEEKNLLAVAAIICKEISKNYRSSEPLRRAVSNEVVKIQRGDYKSYAEYAGQYDGIGEGDICGKPRVSENFMIVEDGIIWTYNEYEIASYSEGHTDVLLPWKSIMPYLKSPDIVAK
jgi:hypothetical protein